MTTNKATKTYDIALSMTADDHREYAVEISAKMEKADRDIIVSIRRREAATADGGDDEEEEKDDDEIVTSMRDQVAECLADTSRAPAISKFQMLMQWPMKDHNKAVSLFNSGVTHGPRYDGWLVSIADTDCIVGMYIRFVRRRSPSK